jgi:hypothetical protein
MATVVANPQTLPGIVKSLTPGTIVQLSPGVYSKPIELISQRGRPDAPIIIRGANTALIDGGQTVDDFTPRAEEVARQAEAAGRYPGVYPIAHEAQLRLSDCSWIALDTLRFQRCWPTAVWIKDSTDLILRDVAIEDSTYAVYAIGEGTRRLLLDHCLWVQDPTRHRLWRDTYWKAVHGTKDIPGSGGARAYDGSFFLGDRIAGELEIKNCTIEHAFNGIHLFNGQLDVRLNRNVNIHHNRFGWIKDNPIEPEDFATNWWIHENEIFNAHKWFSFEMKGHGYFYVFRNCGYFTDKPGPPDEEFSGGAVFKLAADPGRTLGPMYVFNNSWYLRSAYIKDGAISDFQHSNNAIQFCTIATTVCDPSKSFFGKAGSGFTQQWRSLNIRFVNDLSNHRNFPTGLNTEGYTIEAGFSGDPLFQDPGSGNFELKPDSPCRAQGHPLNLACPNGTRWSSRTPLDIGASQSREDAFDGLAYAILDH